MQMPNAVDVRMFRTEAPERDQKPRFTQAVDDFGEAARLAARLLRHLEYDTLRRQTQRFEIREQRVAVARIHQRGGMQAEKEPFVVTVDRSEIAQMQRFGQPPELEQITAACGLLENVARRYLPSVFVVRAQRSVIADRA